VITAGLTAEDRVIVTGLMRVRPGMKVTAQETEATAASVDASNSRPN
jgi:hypothetical protein